MITGDNIQLVSSFCSAALAVTTRLLHQANVLIGEHGYKIGPAAIALGYSFQLNLKHRLGTWRRHFDQRQLVRRMNQMMPQHSL